MSITDLDEALMTAIRQDAFADGVEYENKRIIKLLEEWVNDDNGDFGDTLELIKGETNG